MGHEHHDHEYMHEHNIPHNHEHEHTVAHAHPHEHHEHDHEYMHEHNIPHTHEHKHEHDHGHSHCDPAHCHEGCAGCSGNVDPRAELIAMMKYMVNHNTAHAHELAGLAGQLKQLGDNTGYEQVMAAVSDFEKGNMRLSAVLAAMNIPNA